MDATAIPVVLYTLIMAIANHKTSTPALRVDNLLTPPLPAPEAPLGKVGQIWVREEKCRSVLQAIFGVPFPKCPRFVQSPKTKRFLELDGFNPTIETSLGMGIAFEHHGAQHRKFPNNYHRTLSQFQRQKYNDSVKIEECEKRGILLVVVWFDDTDIEQTIRSQLAADRKK